MTAVDKKAEANEWLDYVSEKLDLFEVHRNEYLAHYNLPAKNMLFYKEVILPFCENTLLMDNIAHSEGIHYDKSTGRNRLKIEVKIEGAELSAEYPMLNAFEHNGNGGCTKPISYPTQFPYIVVKDDKCNSLDEAFMRSEIIGTEDIEICLGSEHSLYSILENILRNSAKHNKNRLTTIDEKKDLIIYLSVKKQEDDQDYYQLDITDNISAVPYSRLSKFHKSIKSNIINEAGSSDNADLGMADIKVNAYLLSTDASITDAGLQGALEIIFRKNDDKEYKVFDPNNNEIIDDDNSKEEILYQFGYRLKLCKPKKVAWIGQENAELRKKGICTFKDKATFEKNTLNTTIENKENKPRPLANYQFAILELDAVKDLTNTAPDYAWDDFLINLPHRVLLNCTNEQFNKNGPQALKDLVKNGRIQCVSKPITFPPNLENENWDFEFIKNCWNEWLRKWEINEKNKGNLVVYLEDADLSKQWEGLTTDVLNVYNPNRNSGTICIDQNLRTVIYDHHSAGRGKLKVDKDTSFVGNYINRDAYFCYDKGSTDFALLAFPSKKMEDRILFALEAFEAGLKKIVIADERIAEKIPYNDGITLHIISDNFKYTKAYRKTEDDVKNPNLSDLANNGNVFLVNKISRCVTNEKNSKDNDIKVSENINAYMYICNQNIKLCFEELNNISLEIGNNKIDGLIIHRTYLQKLLEKYNSKEDKKKFMSGLYDFFKRVVIVSGGGKPHSLELNPINFKPFSALSSCFAKYPSKINLNKIL